MNHIHRVVWSAVRGAFIVAHELASACGKSSSLTRATATETAPAAPRGSLTPPSAFGFATIALAVCCAVQPQPALAAPAANTLPTGGQIVGGVAAGTISTNGAAMAIGQNQPRMIANWETYSIGQNASVHYQQPAGGVALNRVTGGQPSEIFGKLTATGSVFLINPNGILFGQSAQVDVGSLVATSMKLSDSDFMDGRLAFTAGNGSVVNQGNLTAAQGGYIALLAPEVRNEGVITASLGQVVLGGAEAVTLSHDTSGLQYAVDKGAVSALVENKGLVQADGGQVLLTARAANQLARAAINNTGTIEAKSLTAKGGRIVLEADDITLAAGSTLNASGATGGGTVWVGGGWQGSGGLHQATTVAMEQGAVIDVSATGAGNAVGAGGSGGTAVLWSDIHNPGGRTTVAGQIKAQGASGGSGGQVETSGHKLTIADSASVNTGGGNWLLDPDNFTIGKSGDITGSALSTALSSSDVSIIVSNTNVATTNLGGAGNANSVYYGDITFNDAVSWSAHTLTLSAYRNINVNNTLTVSGTGGLTLSTNTGNVTGGNTDGYLKLGHNGSSFDGNIEWSSSATPTMNGSSYTKVSTETELAAITGSNKYFLANNIALTGAWTPITSFSGVMDGFGHTLANLNLSNGTSTSNDQGLFGTITGAKIQNIGVTSGTITGGNNIGTLVGRVASGTNYLRSVFTAPATSGSANVTVESVTGAATKSFIGGLVGKVDASTLYVYDSSNGAYVNAKAGSPNKLNYVGGVLGGGSGTNTVGIYGSSNSGQIVSGTLAKKNAGNALGYAVGGIMGGYDTNGTVTLSIAESTLYNGQLSRTYTSNSGDIFGNYSVAGILGGNFNNTTFSQSPMLQYLKNTGNIQCYGGSVGGIVGAIYPNKATSIDYASNTGAISATGLYSGNIGGLVGDMHMWSANAPASISYSYNEGTISGTGSNDVGGLIGFLSAEQSNDSLSIRYSYNVGSVSGLQDVGGLAGVLRAMNAASVVTLSQVHSAGSVSGTTRVSAFGNLMGGYSPSPLVFNSSNALYSDSINGSNSPFTTRNVSVLTSQGNGYTSVADASLKDASILGNTNAQLDGSQWAVGGAVLSGGYPYLKSNPPETRYTVTINVNALSKTYGDNANPSLSGQYSLSGCNGCITLDWGSLLTGTTAAGSYAYNTGNLLALTYVSGDARSYSLSWSGTYFTVNPKAVTLTGSKTYDGNATTSGATLSVSNTVNGDTVTVTNGGTASIASRNVGSRSLSDFAGLSLSNSNYTLSGASGSINVSARPLTISTSNVTKTYDGGTTASGTAVASGGTSLGTGDTLSGGSFAFTDKDYGAGNKTVTVSGVTVNDGNGGNNYATPSYANNTTSTINKATLTVTGSKTYDGSTDLTGFVTLGGLVGTETLNVTSATASNAHVATADKYVSAITLADGSNGGVTTNYSLPAYSYGAGVNSVTINAKPVTLSASKTYDGSTGLTGAVTVSTGIGGEALTYTGATANDSHVATANKYINAIALADGSGGTATDYTLPTLNAANAPVTITTATLTPALTNAGVTKAYDGGTSSGITPTWSFAGLVSGDTAASISYTGRNYNSKDVLAANTVTVSGLSISGITGGNSSATTDYVLDAASKTVAAAITPKTLTVSGLAASNKTYNALTDVTISNWGSVTTGVSTETLVLNHGTASFADKNTANGKTVTAAGYSLADGTNGGLASNYQLSSTSATTTADITAKPLTLTASKTYSGTTDLTGFVTLGGLVGTETLNVTSATASNAHVATADKYVSAITLADGSNGGVTTNYSLPAYSYGAGVNSVTINAKPVTLSASKTYDGSTGLTGAVTVSTGIGGEALTYTGATANDSHVATANKYINAIALADGSGGTATDYTLPTLNNANAPVTINAKTVTLSASKTYDGSTALGAGTVTIGGLIGSETLNYTGATANSKDAAIAAYISAITLQDGTNGGLAGDYRTTSLAAVNSGNSARVTRKTLSMSGLSAQDKTYDGLTAAVISLGTVNGLVDSEQLTVSGVGSFSDANVGTGKAVTIKLALADGANGGLASNYSIADATATAAIMPVPQTVAPPPPSVPTSPVPPPTVPDPPAPPTPPAPDAGGGSGGSGFISVRPFGATALPVDTVFSFTLPKDTFKHADPKATVVLEARMTDGKSLPDWLTFDSGTGRFTGRAPQGVQEIEVRVVARDTAGGEAATKVMLRFNAASEVK